MVIDLSNYELSDDELADLIEAMDETGLLDGGYDDGGELSDDELEGLMQAAEAEGYGDGDPFTEFDQTFSARAQAQADREDARAAAIVEDTLYPARRDEDKIARIFSRAAQGVYDGQQAVSFAAESAAIELAGANGGLGPCGYPDEFGRCSSRYHELGCSHDVSTDWMAQSGGPLRETYAMALASADDGLALANIAPAAMYGDPDDPDEPSYAVPQQTLELAHQLAVDWGLDGTPGDPGAQAYLDLLRAPAAPVTVADAMYESMGTAAPPQPEQPSYPGIKELRAQMGI